MATENYKIIGNHPLVRNVRRRIRRVAPTHLHVTIYGEQGTEKEIIAQDIHRKSLRKQDVFIDLDCSHLKGEESVSEEQFQNVFNSAWEGTLFLKNIEKLPSPRQIQLFNLLTVTKRVYEFSTQQKPQGVRIITETDNRDLRSQDTFNSHLFSQINQYEIELAPVRERKSDIPLLFDYYLSKTSERLGMDDIPSVSDELFRSIIEYNWSGNTSEIRMVIESMLEMSPNDELSTEVFPYIIPQDPLSFLDTMDYHSVFARVDEYLIRKALKDSGWNQTRAARHLNMTEGTIRLKIKKYGILRNN
jgi:DNA-binding NtrC family response regulator